MSESDSRRYYATGDLLGLVAELNGRRIKQVFGHAAATSIGSLQLTRAENANLRKCRELHYRFMRREYSATTSEIEQMRALCETLVAQDRRNKGQDVGDVAFPWESARMYRKEDPGLPRDAYEQLGMKMLTGEFDAATGK